ncbi:unnamed protein product [Adineta steineri]|uniref:Carbohydrate sulfotransferase n=1 Tax=Adineta steineri TaxID=433720 RepID=A0A813TRQ2_9BILA|nr:unnamed protein product [Adineta steineri]
MLRHRRFILILNLILSCFLIIFLILQSNEQNPALINYCLINNITSSKEFYSNLVYIPTLNILFCDVPKAASTNLRRLIYGYLNPSNSFTNLDRKQIWLDHKDFFKKYYLTKTNFEFILNNSNRNLFKFLLVRHPFQRIYSVYYDKFVNNHIDDTLSGWKQLEEDILLQMNTNQTLLTIRRNDIKLDFRTFLLYIIDSIKRNQLINSHWEQIVQRCAFCSINYNFIGKIENFHQDKKFLLKKLNQNSNKIILKFPSKEIDKQSKKQILLNDSQLIQFFRDTIQNDNDFEILIDYYKPDFQLFNYEIPNL